jgi:predicted phage gp36 major capsid-like protein
LKYGIQSRQKNKRRNMCAPEDEMRREWREASTFLRMQKARMQRETGEEKEQKGREGLI